MQHYAARREMDPEAEEGPHWEGREYADQEAVVGQLAPPQHQNLTWVGRAVVVVQAQIYAQVAVVELRAQEPQDCSPNVVLVKTGQAEVVAELFQG